MHNWPNAMIPTASRAPWDTVQVGSDGRRDRFVVERSLGLVHAAQHGAGDDIPGRAPGVAHRWREQVAETLFERPEQGRADDVEVLGPHAVANMSGAQPDEERGDLVQRAEPIDGGLQRRDGPYRLRGDVVAEERPGSRSELEDPLVE